MGGNSSAEFTSEDAAWLVISSILIVVGVSGMLAISPFFLSGQEMAAWAHPWLDLIFWLSVTGAVVGLYVLAAVLGKLPLPAPTQKAALIWRRIFAGSVLAFFVIICITFVVGKRAQNEATALAKQESTRLESFKQPHLTVLEAGRQVVLMKGRPLADQGRVWAVVSIFNPGLPAKFQVASATVTFNGMQYGGGSIYLNSLKVPCPDGFGDRLFGFSDNYGAKFIPTNDFETGLVVLHFNGIAAADIELSTLKITFQSRDNTYISDPIINAAYLTQCHPTPSVGSIKEY